MKTKAYKLVEGSHTRGEGGRKVTYEAADPERNTIHLSEEEYRFLRLRVEPIDSTFSEPGPAPNASAETEPKADPTVPPEALPKPEPEPELKPEEPNATPEEETPEEEAPPRDWSETLSGNSEKATEALVLLTDPEEVHNLAQQEADGKNRKGVLSAAAARLEELEGGEGG